MTKEVVPVLTTRPTKQRTMLDTAYTHECHHGFCMVCGSVWPCSRARKTTPTRSIPIPRADDVGY